MSTEYICFCCLSKQEFRSKLMTTTWKAINDQSPEYIQQLLQRQLQLNHNPRSSSKLNQYLRTRISLTAEPIPLLLQNSGIICLTVSGISFSCNYSTQDYILDTYYDSWDFINILSIFFKYGADHSDF